jgi:hypothetical protein
MSRSLDPTKPAVWRERFERFSSCGLAVARFCAQEHVSVASFYHWRKMLGHKGRRRRTTDGHPRHRTSLADGRGVFQPIAVVSAGRAVCIQLPCGTRIEVGADDLDAVRTVVAEVARAEHGCEVARAEHGREAGVARC